MRLPAAPAVPVHPRALILAAGRGERMRPLTDHTPKPLLVVRGKPLLQRWVETLRAGGVEQIVVNTAWLGEQIESHFGLQRPPDGREQLLNQEYSPAASPLRFSCEGRDFGYALETAGVPPLPAGHQSDDPMRCAAPTSSTGCPGRRWR